MECAVCLRNWSSEDCIPKSLACGHSFCVQCLDLIFAKHKTAVLCPTCLAAHQMTAAQLQSLPKNYSLLALIKDEASVAKEAVVSDIQEIVPEKKGGKEESSVKVADQSLVEKEVTLRPYCSKHKMLLHSFVPGTKQLLCDKCITELPKTVTSIVPIAKVSGSSQ